MANKQKKMLQEALEDARLETELPKKYDNPKVGSVDRPIPRTARLNMLESVRGIENPDAKKYIEYADKEAREAVAEKRRETRGMQKAAKSLQPPSVRMVQHSVVRRVGDISDACCISQTGKIYAGGGKQP